MNAKVVVPLKCLSNLWKSPDLLLINCGTELDLVKIMYKGEVLRTFRAFDPNADSVLYKLTSQATSATFQINNV